jgi:hypothetical protein
MFSFLPSSEYAGDRVHMIDRRRADAWHHHCVFGPDNRQKRFDPSEHLRRQTWFGFSDTEFACRPNGLDCTSPFEYRGAPGSMSRRHAILAPALATHPDWRGITPPGSDPYGRPSVCQWHMT